MQETLSVDAASVSSLDWNNLTWTDYIPAINSNLNYSSFAYDQPMTATLNPDGSYTFSYIYQPPDPLTWIDTTYTINTDGIRYTSPPEPEEVWEKIY